MADPLWVQAFYPDDATGQERESLEQECARLGLSPPTTTKEFLNLLHRICYVDRSALVAFDVPREIGRLAQRWSPAAREPGRGGVSHILFTVPGKPNRRNHACRNGEIEDNARPRIVINAIDGVRARIQFKPVKGEPRWPGVFVSLRPQAEALSGQRRITNLAEALETFGLPAVVGQQGSSTNSAVTGVCLARCGRAFQSGGSACARTAMGENGSYGRGARALPPPSPSFSGPERGSAGVLIARAPAATRASPHPTAPHHQTPGSPPSVAM